MFRFGAVDCDGNSSICVKEKVSEFPVFRIYPPHPIPHVDVLVDENFSIEKLKKTANRFVNNKTIEITNTNIDAFLDDNPMKPKVLLFTDKKGIPVVYKALSDFFEVIIASLN
jgi:hypothetical protein